MIKYIQKKHINFSEVQNILTDSINLNHFTNRGPAKYLLENKLQDLLSIDSSKRLICVTNGTLALHALMLFYEKKHKRVIKWATPSFTFPSPVVGRFNASIVDIESDTYTIALNDKNLNKFDGFIITNLFGTYPSNIEDWIVECKKREKILIFDNASSPLSTFNNVNICNLGNSSFGSLHHTKYLGFGEGGFIVLDKEYYDEINSILGFGFDGTSIKRIHSKYSSNFKISDVSSAFILQHVKNYNIKKHKQVQDLLVEQICDIEKIKLFNYNKNVVYGNLPILYEKYGDNTFFRDQGIESHKYYYPLKKTKNSTKLFEKIVNLPLHSDLTDFEIENIISTIKRSIR